MQFPIIAQRFHGARWRLGARVSGAQRCSAQLLRAVVEQAGLALGRVGADRLLVGVAAPAGPVRHDEVAVLEHRRVVDQLVVPGQAVDVGLHDAQVRHGGREVRVHHRAQVAVEVVRRHVDLVRLGAGRDLHRLPHAVPGRVDDGHVHGLLAEVGQELAQAQQRLARGDRVRAGAADMAQRLGAEGVDLDPEHVEVGDLAQDLEIALGLGVEVEVEQQIDVGPRALADGLQVHAQIAQHVPVDVELGIERRAEAGAPALGVLGALPRR